MPPDAAADFDADISLNLDHLRRWLGRQATQADTLDAGTAAAMAATLDLDGAAPADGDALPPLWHWLYFKPPTPARDLGPDGHAQRGGFLPPVGLPRRMWAGGRLQFARPLRLGQAVRRDSKVVAVDMKQGRSGPLVFVTVEHQIHDVNAADGPAWREAHDIVYRGGPAVSAPADAGGAPEPPPPAADFERRIRPDPVLLFRYSALTFNGHRIHYDQPYATGVEGYPGLVVHGPLIATLLLDLLRRHHPAARVQAFSFKALRPVFDQQPLTLCGRWQPGGAALWALDGEGRVAMRAQADVAQPVVPAGRCELR